MGSCISCFKLEKCCFCLICIPKIKKSVAESILDRIQVKTDLDGNPLDKEGEKIISGLNKIKSQIDKGKFIFQEKFEDIHLNIENKLFDIIGPSAGYMHTGRSRNDQVVTDFKLWVRNSSKDILKDISNLMKSLIKKAESAPTLCLATLKSPKSALSPVVAIAM